MVRGAQRGRGQVDPLVTGEENYTKNKPITCAWQNVLYNILEDTNNRETVSFNYFLSLFVDDD